MRFDWDAEKSARNLVDRGFDFAFASLMFESPTLERPDSRRDYGEPRTVAIGRADGITLTMVYTDRHAGGEMVRRIISARRSDRRERRAYERATKTT